MKDELGTEASEVQSTPAPRKVLLGKKVVRHFAVRTGVQTGNTSTNLNCANQTILSNSVKATGVRC